MAAISRKRKNKEDSEKNYKRRPTLLSSDEEDTPTAYEVLVNSIPSAVKSEQGKQTQPSSSLLPLENELHSAVEDDEGEIDSTVELASAISSKEPFSAHYERVLEESEVQLLRELYSKPLLTLHKYQHSVLGSVQWLTTPTSMEELVWKDDIVPQPLKDLHVREPLASLWVTVNKTSVEEPFSPLQYHMFDIINSYKDLIYTNQTFDNESEIRRLYVLHCLNHVVKNRSHVLKNNVRLALAANEGRDLGEIRDQGITRPKVLILVPFRNSALKVVSTMIGALVRPGKGEVANRKKFFKLYSEEGNTKPPEYKPASYHQMFSGNIDDCFRMGLSVKKNRIKLFTQFYSSDIVLASPLGLRTIIGGEGDKKRDYDFLSSLEMIIVDQADVFLMQNWDHLLDIFRHLHLQPSESHGVDFSRVREWALNCWGGHYCQLLLFSSFLTPEINSLFNTYSRNYEGQVRIHGHYWKGSVFQVLKLVPHVFHNLRCSDHQQLPEARFQYFIDTILPLVSGPDFNQVCIYVPSYFDFVRVRNLFKKEEYNFCHISEYTKSSSVSRARSYFARGSKKFLLMTERFHFFRRYHLKGIHHLVFYAPPTYCEFYAELVNQMENRLTSKSKVIVLYSKFDALSLQRIVGTDRVSTLINSTDTIYTLTFN